MHATLNDWIQSEAIRFSVDSADALNAAIDTVVASLSSPQGESVELLGFGEALHGGEEILLLRNRLFQRLVEAHGFSAIAVESSFPRSRLVNAYVGSGSSTRQSYEEIQEQGFSHGFGRVEANRELVEWMRQYNADPAHSVKLRFYGFDMPGLTGKMASPRDVLFFATDYLASLDSASGGEHRQRIDTLLGEDSQWENPAIYADPAKAAELAAAIAGLRIATENLLTELRTRRPELLAKTDQDQYLEALQHAQSARELLNFYAGVASQAGYAKLLGIRDAAMADDLMAIVARERPRGKVLAFAHNSHLQHGQVEFPQLGQWWPAGSHLSDMLGARYAVIGTGLSVSEANGIGPPASGSLEALLTAPFTSSPAGAVLIPTHRGQKLHAAQIAALTTRFSTTKNPSYKPLNAQSFTDFDWLAILDSATYTRGMPPLADHLAVPEQRSA